MERINPAAKARSLLPSIPVVPSSHEQPSPLYKLVLDNLENPPLLKGASWTKAAPFKEDKYARTPSESIANNYTPSACNIKLRALRRRTRSSRKLIQQFKDMSLCVDSWYLQDSTKTSTTSPSWISHSSELSKWSYFSTLPISSIKPQGAIHSNVKTDTMGQRC